MSLRSAEVASAPDCLLRQYRAVRAQSLKLAAPLSDEDMVVQSMPDASPTKWHLAHTTWFFETFILSTTPGYRVFDEAFSFLFNSYYESLGPRQPRPQRGLITRPPVKAVLTYRRHVDAAMEALLSGPALSPELQSLLVLGFSHEQQHQELLLTDILHLMAQSPLRPAYDAALPAPATSSEIQPMDFIPFDGGVVQIGRPASEDPHDFAFDNESPRHEVYLRPYRLADRLVTNGEWLAFMADGGYAKPEFWLSEGWAQVRAEGWMAPFYWRDGPDGTWDSLTLAGPQPIQRDAPVVHISYYEADAYAHWRGLRLPTEAEWEHAAETLAIEGNFSDHGVLRPAPAGAATGELRQVFGDCWEWTASSYLPYPGFKAEAGAVGEYNGKFMVNQMVLRGGSCATPQDHIRATYRNFFHPHQRWQFSGLRLAEDAPAKRATGPIVDSSFRRDVVDGLSQPQKAIPSKYFYDEAGSALFEQICDLDEYYPTRTEAALLGEISPALAQAMPDGAVLVEFGSGSSTKTRLLLSAAPRLKAYAPIDISPDAVNPAGEALARDYPNLLVEPIVGDFTRPMTLPASLEGMPRVGFFPGSTIGNFASKDAEAFLKTAKAFLGEGSSFIVGVDLAKDVATLVAAYDDALGVTAAFNLNLLTRINRELGGDFDLDSFTHRAIWNGADSRMEMHLVSKRAQTVMVAGRAFRFAAGETIHTENSHKYQPDVFSRIAETAGWTVAQVWTAEPGFGVFLLKA